VNRPRRSPRQAAQQAIFEAETATRIKQAEANARAESAASQQKKPDAESKAVEQSERRTGASEAAALDRKPGS